jgi:hypothetical protein
MTTPGLGIAGLIFLLLGQVVAKSDAPGRRVDLGGATLFVPADRGAGSGTAGVADLVFHLHGAPSVVEPAFLAARRPGEIGLVEFNRSGLSRVYAEPFSDPALFPRLIDGALAALKDPGADEPPRLGRLTVSSFSAGFGGVRELLKVPAHFARIDTLVMADSLYCGYTGDAARHEVDPQLMDGFRRFAIEAAAGRKTFVLTHSAQVPEGYASTTETADFLIRAVNGTPEATDVSWVDGWTQTRRFARGRFLVLGFAGTEGADHMRHLRGIARIWEAIPQAADPSR